MKIRFRALSLVLLSAIVALTMSACGGDSSSSPTVTHTHTVSGTITLPASADGKTYMVGVTTDIDSGPVAFYQGVISGTGMTVDYSISGVPAGTYYVMAVVYQTGSGPDPVDGDYFGTYGWAGGSDPASMGANVAVSEDTSAIDFTMIVCGCGP